VPHIHLVEQGETIVALAERYGFFACTLWEHPLNAALSARRERMDVLYPGDEVAIPDLRRKTVAIETDRRHTFRRRGLPAVIRLVLRRNGHPRANVPYRIEVGAKVIEGHTNDDGLIEARVPASARLGKLYLDGRSEPIELRLGHMDPHDTISGVRKRLANLGLDAPTTDDTTSEEWQRVLGMFQRQSGLPSTGILDERTRLALVAAHDRRPQKAGAR
jgi:hypothetical protein